MDTFALPTAEESDWVLIGRGFNALLWYKKHKKEIGKKKTTTVTVAVEVRDDDDIVDFLQTVIDHSIKIRRCSRR
jgi:hypothetical protein